MSREDLARRAVAAWQKCGLDWIPGMLDDLGWRLLLVDVDGPEFWIWRSPSGCEPPSGYIARRPDLDDHATLGCIEHGMLPAVWTGCAILVRRSLDAEGRMTVDIEVVKRGRVLFSCYEKPLSEALLSSLEAAAERRQP